MKLPWGLRWWELLPEVVLGAGLLLFLLDETDAATSAFESRRALVLMVAVSAAWLATRLVLVRYTRWPALRLAVFAAVAAGVLAVVVLPAYDDTTVVETLPVAAAPTSPTGPTVTTPGPTAAPPEPPTTTQPPQPVAVGSADLHGIDHRASGTVVLYRQPDASFLVGLEGIDIQAGPDYDVYAVPGADREDVDGGVRLDDLRGNQGTQYYEVPGDIDVTDGPWTVLVWCETFDVPVAGATPA